MKNVSRLLFSVLLIITITSCAQKTRKQIIEPHLTAKQLSGYSQATFAAGCFWHEEALFESIKGVKEAVSGYAGGTTNNPTYETCETGTTDHAETVNVYYDSSVVTYPTLLKIYFSGQDPTQVNGQGPDHGTQYRSILFYRNDQEKRLAQAYIKSMQTSGKYEAPIAVQLMPFTKFWQAEEYHQNYIDRNPGSGYVQMVSIPEIKKLQKEYPQLVKPDHIY
ncbi:peptide-methionine (S)-S-oxide reductase MsrA [Segetibacter koreensis]|uniref:peptide-methionine (S)-S-oxide reductase MsrA n=1 Tax=Segetibacter koreensis TaxID=398037 RepID=UPI00037F7231|nr:peptide-methionine (S)-S-oxide reductase MsrA [Segetibacter koreensis]